MTAQTAHTELADHRKRRGRPPGTTPRWQILFAAMDAMEEVGQLLSYEQMGDLLGLDVHNIQGKQAIMAAARKAVNEMRTQRNTMFQMVRGRGFERAQVGQVIEIARRHQARAVASVRAGHDVIVTINPDELDATTAAVVRATVMAFARQSAYMRQLDVRQERLDAAIAAVSATAQTAVTRADEAASQAAAAKATADDLQSRISALERQRPGVAAVPHFLPPGTPGA